MNITQTKTSELSVRKLTKEFVTPEGTTFTALREIDLDIVTGEFFVMLGPSGCGKTTLLRSIAGLEQPTTGEIWLGDRRIDQLPPYKRTVNTVFQAYALFPHLNVKQNISFGLEMEGKNPKSREVQDRVSEMLALVGLEEFGNRKPMQLSGGQQQRVALARSLAKRPAVLLLDEPLSALDLKLRREMQTELKRIQVESGITFIFVTHDQEEAMSMGDRIAVFNQGEIAQIGVPRDLYGAPKNRFVAEFIGEMNFLTGVGLDGGVQLSSGEFLDQKFLASPVSEGEDVTIGVRPEYLSVEVDGPIAGHISTSQFIGTDLRLCVSNEAGADIWVRVDANYDGPMNPGEAIRLQPHAQSVRVIEE